jgi:hypothetical protein
MVEKVGMALMAVVVVVVVDLFLEVMVEEVVIV